MPHRSMLRPLLYHWRPWWKKKWNKWKKRKRGLYHLLPGEPAEQTTLTLYDDLKPPTSPSPTASTSKLDAPPVQNVSNTEKSSTGSTIVTETAPTPQRTRPLSPYAAYADLQPPMSPTPTASGPKEIVSGTSASAENVSELLGGNDVAKTAIATTVTEQISQSYSPFSVYEDLKPPTSPSPSFTSPSSVPKPHVNNVSETSISSSNNMAQPEKTTQEKHNQASPKPRPLSPYAMYEVKKGVQICFEDMGL